MVKTSLVIASIAGAALSSAALAQDVDFLPRAVKSVNGRAYQANPFASRTAGVVFNSSAGRCISIGVPAQDAIEDANFAPGPWAGRKNNLVTTLSTRSFVNGLLTGYSWDVGTIFWRGADFSLATDMTANAEPVAGVRINFLPLTNTVSAVFGADVDISTLNLVLPTDNIFIEQFNITGGGTTLLARTEPASVAIGRQTAGQTIGSTTTTMGIDIGGPAGNFEGAASNSTLTGTYTTPASPIAATYYVLTPSPAPASDRVNHNVQASALGACTAGQATNLLIALSGEGGGGYTTPPTVVSSATPLDNGSVSVSGTLSGNQVNWHKITLNGDATDWARQFLDILVTENSGDVAIALYYENGRIAGLPNGNTAGTMGVSQNTAPVRDQLSYGIGRRSAPSNGVQFSGQSGEIFAGTFYLAVVRHDGAEAFSQDFAVSSFAGAGTASYTINFSTNVNGTALQPAVEPAVIQDLGTLSAGNVTATSASIPPGGEGWYKFDISATVAACSGGPEFLDIDFGNSESGADTIAFIFDASGLALFVSDDRGTTATSPGAFLPAFSFGAVGPRTYPGVANPYDGNYNGSAFTLHRGTYYVGVVNFPGNVAVRFGDRWHIRWGGDDAATGYTLAPLFATNAIHNPPGTVQSDCLGDLDDDGDIATGLAPDCGVDVNDLVAFLAGLEQGDSRVDLDDGGGEGVRDGGVDINDLVFMLTRLENGC